MLESRSLGTPAAWGDRRLGQVNMPYPASDWGAAESGRDRQRTRHLPRLVCVLCGEHGRACQGWEGGWRVGMGRPRRNSEALQAVKWGIVVGVQESCAHGEGPEGEGRERV